MKEIVNGLFVGDTNDASSIDELREAKIKLIICAARGMHVKKYLFGNHLDHPCFFRGEIQYIEYPLLDNEADNVLQYVDDCFSQVSSRLGLGNRVLIHCAQGVSRSVSLVTAFIMRSNMVPFGEAYMEVKRRYPEANIADNFKMQLEEYGSRMMWAMSLNTQPHRLFRCKLDIRDPNLCNSQRPTETATYRYLCRKCRSCLFLDAHVVPVPCENYLVECMQWMSEEIDSSIEGALLCYGCKGKLGQFNWNGLAGQNEFPGFVITKSKVDRMPLVSSYVGDGFPKTRF
jgi:dual specificity phosphatase 12